MTLHPSAATGFSRSSAAYERGRPGYPPEAVAWLVERAGLGPGRRVLDLAAGTGKLTRELLGRGAEVVAVEPLAAMRAALPHGAEALDGTAEAIPLGDASVDTVTVGQAFHWFDHEPALAEIHRVLRPGGRLALAWNLRREDDEVNVALDQLMAPHRAGTPSHRDGRWLATLTASELFGPLEEVQFAADQTLDAEGLADRIGSISFVASLADEERLPLLERVRALAGGGTVTVPYTTTVQICSRLP